MQGTYNLMASFTATFFSASFFRVSLMTVLFTKLLINDLFLSLIFVQTTQKDLDGNQKGVINTYLSN